MNKEFKIKPPDMVSNRLCRKCNRPAKLKIEWQRVLRYADQPLTNSEEFCLECSIELYEKLKKVLRK